MLKLLNHRILSSSLYTSVVRQKFRHRALNLTRGDLHFILADTFISQKWLFNDYLMFNTRTCPEFWQEGPNSTNFLLLLIPFYFLPFTTPAIPFVPFLFFRDLGAGPDSGGITTEVNMRIGAFLSISATTCGVSFSRSWQKDRSGINRLIEQLMVTRAVFAVWLQRSVECEATCWVSAVTLTHSTCLKLLVRSSPCQTNSLSPSKNTQRYHRLKLQSASGFTEVWGARGARPDPWTTRQLAF